MAIVLKNTADVKMNGAKILCRKVKIFRLVVNKDDQAIRIILANCFAHSFERFRVWFHTTKSAGKEDIFLIKQIKQLRKFSLHKRE